MTDVQFVADKPYRLCKDCRWAGRWLNSYGLGECQHPNAVVEINLTTGKIKRQLNELCRKYGPCGPEGNLFERRQSRVVRFLASLFKAIIETSSIQ